MTQKMLRLHLELVPNQPNQYLLSWQDIHYPTTVRFENDLVFTDLLRAFPELLLWRRPSWLQVKGDPLKVLVKVTSSQVAQSKPVSVVRYCAHCNHPNRLELPDNLDVHVFILGQDRGFLGYQGSQHVPIVQGEQD